MPITPPSTPFEKVGLDQIGSFPRLSRGNKWIIVCADYMTAYCETATLSSTTAAQVSKFTLHSIVLWHGPPRVMISGRGRQFTVDVVEELLCSCASEFRHFTAYHPQTDGLTELTNRTLINMLSMYVASHHKILGKVLPFVTYACNSVKHETTGYSPFFSLYVRSPCHTLDTISLCDSQDDLSITETLCHAEGARQFTRLHTLAAQDYSKACYDSQC